MAKTYAEFLAENGATPEELKTMVTPVSEKAYAAMQQQTTEAISRATKAESDKAAYDKWYKEVAEPTAAKALSERDAAQADAAAERARLKKLQDLGLVAIAEQMGEKIDPVKAEATTTGSVDLSKYVTSDTLYQVAEREGDAIATAQDIAFEHQRLFPDKPLNFRELRKQALANKRSVEEQWQSNFNVQAVREQRAQSDKEAYEKRLREEGASSERAKLQTANPNLVTPVSSTSPFTGRPPSAQDASLPWQKTDSERENARLQKGLSKVLAVQ